MYRAPRSSTHSSLHALNDWWTTQPDDLTADVKATQAMLTPPTAPDPVPAI